MGRTICEGQALLIIATQDYLKENQRKRLSVGKVAKFEVGQYVLIQYPQQASRQIIGPLSLTDKNNNFDRSSKRHQWAVTDRKSLIRSNHTAMIFQIN